MLHPVFLSSTALRFHTKFSSMMRVIQARTLLTHTYSGFLKKLTIVNCGILLFQTFVPLLFTNTKVFE